MDRNARTGRVPPPDILAVGFDFAWDVKLLWALDLPVQTVPVDDLLWHFDVRFLWSSPDGYYDLTPRQVMGQPELYPEQQLRVQQADTNYPIDIMFYRGHWVILDGLHRLMKLVLAGCATAQVRKVPRSAVPLIRRS
jgi:hypothetical protein